MRRVFTKFHYLQFACYYWKEVLLAAGIAALWLSVVSMGLIVLYKAAFVW